MTTLSSEAERLAARLENMRGPFLGDGINEGVNAYELAALLRRIPELEADAENYRARLFRALEADPILKDAHEQVDDCRRNPTFMDMSKLLDVASANFTERKRVEAERDQLRAELEHRFNWMPLPTQEGDK